jgi:mannose-6-phosphate isomerase
LSIIPVKFKPIYKERIWGSDRLGRFFNKDLPGGALIGESWELADLQQGCSVIENGTFAGMNLRHFLEKNGLAYGFTPEQCTPPFGLLIKLLDANQVLSVQVHPDAEACLKFPKAALKTECWYVLAAAPNSVIYRGLKPGIGKEEVKKAVVDNTLDSLMNVYTAQKGDFHYLPAGTIHALGAGVIVAEIQTPSDTTYRLYDWGRVDENGRGRELHIGEALDAIHYTDTPPTVSEKKIQTRYNGQQLKAIADQLGVNINLLDCEYFSVNHLSVETVDTKPFQCPIPFVMMILDGCGHIGIQDEGDTLLLPSVSEAVFHARESVECLLTCLGPVKAA